MSGEGPWPVRRDDTEKTDLRASDEDRERAADALRIAAGDGRLTPDELDERLEVALTARTNDQLIALTADLPEVNRAPGAKELVRLDAHGGSGSRRGRWVVPQRMEILAVGGSVKLDFSDAVITSPTLNISGRNPRRKVRHSYTARNRSGRG
jgi:Domain of unknown function (DUF1707)